MKVLTGSEQNVMMNNIAELQKTILDSVSDPKDFIRATEMLVDMAIIVAGVDGANAIKDMVDKDFES